MVDILEKYDSLLNFVKKEYDDNDFYEDLLDFLYQRERSIEDEEAIMIEALMEGNFRDNTDEFTKIMKKYNK